MSKDDAFAKLVNLLSPYLVRGLVNTENPMPKVKDILEDLWATAHAEGYTAGAEEAYGRGYNEGWEERGHSDARYSPPEL